jgi:hypothetical protein
MQPKPMPVFFRGEAMLKYPSQMLALDAHPIVAHLHGHARRTRLHNAKREPRLERIGRE